MDPPTRNALLVSIGWLLVLIVFENVAMTSVKRYTVSKQWYFLALAMLLYGLCVPPLLAAAAALDGIGLANTLWNCLSTVSMVVIGVAVFRERMTLTTAGGVALSLVAIALIIMGGASRDAKPL